jgi:drug/metabolite transporter (DMT)-like permease
MNQLELSSFGLLLAAVLSVCNVFTDVSRKKVVERHDLVAATFWIRVFAAVVFTGAIVIYALSGSPPFVHAPAEVTSAQIKNLPALVAKLQAPADPVSELVRSRLSEETRGLLDRQSPGPVSKELSGALLADLNGPGLIRGGLLYDPQVFSDVTLSAEAAKLLTHKNRGDALAYVNRLLLEDAYPDAFVGNRDVELFGVSGVMVPPLVAFLVYLAILVGFIGLAQLLLMKALQVSPMSLCIPFMAFTPVFLIGTGYVVLGELPSAVKLLGVFLIVIGSLVMHRKLFATGWTAPFQAIVKEKGSRYVLTVALILAITNPIEKQLILMSDPLTPAFGYGLGLVLFFAVLVILRRSECAVVMRKNPHWAILAGVLDASALLIQYVTITYLAVVITISIKRAGIVLAILAGWLIFKERDIRDKLIAVSGMVGGVLIFYLPLSATQAIVLAAAVLAGMGIALYLTHQPATPTGPQAPTAPAVGAETKTS